MIDRKQFLEGLAAAFAGMAKPTAVSEPLESGKLYALSLEVPVDGDYVRKLKENLKPYEDQFGIKFMVLHPGMSVYPIDMNPKQIAAAVVAELRKQGISV